MAGDVIVMTDEIRHVLESYERSGRNLNRVLPEIAAALVSAVDDVYQKEGPGWPGFAPSTVRSRGSMGAAKLLQNNGDMIKSTMGETGSNWAQAITTIPYAKYHVTGNARLPKRNPFELGPFEADVLDDVAQILLDEVVGG